MYFDIGYVKIASYFGAALAVGISSITTGYGSGIIAGEASYALMRQPQSRDKLFRTMLISQAAAGTGSILALVIALLLIYGGFDVVEGGWIRASVLLAAGISIGFGSVGPAQGSGAVGGGACKALGRMPVKEGSIIGNMLVGQALAQSGSIFALLVSLLLLYSTPLQAENAEVSFVVIKCLAYLGAGISIGFGTIGPGIGIGFAAQKATEMIGTYPKNSMEAIRLMFLGSAVAQSTAIYSLIISFLLMFAF